MDRPLLSRRQLLGGAVLAFGLSSCAGAPGAVPRLRISAAQLERALAQRFPLRHSLQGLVRLDLPAPRLRLLPQDNRIATEFSLTAGGPALRRELHGVFDVDFALRYDALDRTIRAVQPRVNTLQVGGLPVEVADALVAYAPVLAEHALRDLILHRLKPEDLTLADTMGLQPGPIHVEADAVVVTFVPKAPQRT